MASLTPFCLHKWILVVGYDMHIHLGMVPDIQFTINAPIYNQRDVPDVCMGRDDFANEVPPSLDFRMRIESIFEGVQHDCQLWLFGEASQNHGCVAVFFDPEFEWIIFPIGQVHNLCGQTVCDTDWTMVVIAPGAIVAAMVNEIDQPLETFSGPHTLFCKAKTRRQLDFTGCGFDNGNISIVMVNDEEVLCLFIGHFVSRSFLWR